MTSSPRRSRLIADRCWAGRWLGPDEVTGEPALRRAQGANRQAQGASRQAHRARRRDPGAGYEASSAEAILRVSGTLVPGLRDHHVHLGLVDTGELPRSALSAFDDLGWIPVEAMGWQMAPPGGCRVRVAGPFLTAPGGYPSGRAWAPDAAVWAIDTHGTGVTAVTELADLGVDMIKVVLHTGLPLLRDEALHGAVMAAHQRGLAVVAHVEGRGQAARAASAGVDAFAHAPWTETLSDEVLASMVGRVTWISTLAIHPADSRARRTATDNLVRFVSAGGRVLYGTDMGNGPTPIGLNIAELEALVHAGLTLPVIMESICRADPSTGSGRTKEGSGRTKEGSGRMMASSGCTTQDFEREVTWTPLSPPEDVRELPEWLATLQRRPMSGFEETA